MRSPSRLRAVVRVPAVVAFVAVVAVLAHIGGLIQLPGIPRLANPPDLGGVRRSVGGWGPVAPVAFLVLYAPLVLAPIPKGVFAAAAGLAFGIPVGLAVVIVGGTLGAAGRPPRPVRPPRHVRSPRPVRPPRRPSRPESAPRIRARPASRS